MAKKTKLPEFSQTVGYIRQIPNEALTVAQIPRPQAGSEEIFNFAYSYDGYGLGMDNGECATIGNGLRESFHKSGKIDAPLSDLRIALFFEARRFHHFGSPPSDEDLRYLRTVLSAMQSKVGGSQQAAEPVEAESPLGVEHFDKIRPALEHCAKLAQSKHAFLMDVCGPKEVEANCSSALQVVDRNRLFHDGDCGLCLYLVFEANDADALARFRLLADFGSCVNVDYDPELKCYALNFGVDVAGALRGVSLVLVQVYGYSVDDEFVCRVYDEAAIDADDEDAIDPESEQKIHFKSAEDVRACRDAGLAKEPHPRKDPSLLFHEDVDPQNAGGLKKSKAKKPKKHSPKS